MPRTYLMKWEGAPAFRWVKMKDGVRYRVSCKDLGATIWTKEASGDLADAWWRKKLEEISPPDPATEMLRKAEINVDDLKRKIEEGQAARAILRNLPVGEKADLEAVEDIIGVGPVEDDGRRLEMLSAVVGKVFPETPPSDRSFKVQTEKFLATIVGEMKPLSFREIRQFVRSLYDVPGVLNANTDVQSIDEDLVEKVYHWLKSAALEQPTRKKRWSFFGRLVLYFSQKRLCAFPLNVKSLKFKTVPKAVRTYSVSTVRDVLAKLTQRQRVYALLGLNCGMTAADIGQLRKDQIDLTSGRLVRRRVKTGDNNNVPTVEYALWSQTAELLREHWSDHPELVLVSQDGTPLYESRYEGEKTPQKDLINQQWKRTGAAIPFKAFRSIGASVLENHEHYGRYVQHFLGHTPKSMAERHYAPPSPEVFNIVVKWLGEQILG